MSQQRPLGLATRTENQSHRAAPRAGLGHLWDEELLMTAVVIEVIVPVYSCLPVSMPLRRACLTVLCHVNCFGRQDSCKYNISREWEAPVYWNVPSCFSWNPFGLTCWRMRDHVEQRQTVQLSHLRSVSPQLIYPAANGRCLSERSRDQPSPA